MLSGAMPGADKLYRLEWHADKHSSARFRGQAAFLLLAPDSWGRGRQRVHAQKEQLFL